MGAGADRNRLFGLEDVCPLTAGGDDALIAAVILAAGESSRMGQLKALLPWDGVPLLTYQLNQLQAAGVDEIVAVVGHQARRLLPLLGRPGVRTVLNTAYQAGKTTSIRAGAEAVSPGAAAVLVAAADQPLSAATVSTLIHTWRVTDARVAVPRYNGRPGHPPLFAGSLIPDLLQVQEQTQGLRQVRTTYRESTCYADVADPLIHLNLNTPDAYAAARLLLAKPAARTS